jgi:hypothetical protein
VVLLQEVHQTSLEVRVGQEVAIKNIPGEQDSREKGGVQSAMHYSHLHTIKAGQ